MMKASPTADHSRVLQEIECLTQRSKLNPTHLAQLTRRRRSREATNQLENGAGQRIPNSGGD
jgi:hypothetical protein